MRATRTSATAVRGLIFAAVMLLSLAWLWALFEDQDVYLMILLSALHLPIGLALLFVDRLAVFSWRFVVALSVTPIVHWVGAFIEAPGCYPYFIGPTVLLVLMGLGEILLSRDKTVRPPST